ncbi:amidohydrolase family protein [Dokdonella sp.]|uniref:amidohydrolase family protein n=1 Tax=Dokdonella sp. TaxID=2291710 RepID=UPI003528BFE2
MKLAFKLVLLGMCCALAQTAMADESFSAIRGGTVVGHLNTIEKNGTVEIDYDYKSNGRGPTIAETIVLDDAGFPVSWTITGASTFGNKIDERFNRDGELASWTDSTGVGSARIATPTLYVDQGASPWGLGMYARALLAEPDHVLPAFPAGELSLSEGETLSVTGKPGTIKVRVYALSGIGLNPSYVLLDDEKALFAAVWSKFIVIRKGYEGEEARLRGVADRLATERFEVIQKETAHHYEAPVRLRNVRVFDPQTLQMGEPVSIVVSGERISSVEPLDSPTTPGEVVIDGEGGSVIAGLNDMHGHLSSEQALLNIAAGVTSVRDMGNDNPVLDVLIRRIDEGVMAGPRITRSGMIEGKSPFNNNNGILVDSQQTALDAVRWYAARGYWQIKLYNSMNPDWARANAAEAHRLGMRVSGHVPAFSTADAMVDAGYDELTHINQIMLGWVLEPGEDTRTLLRLTALKRLPALDLQSESVQQTLQHIAAKHVAVEPTIGIHERLLLGRNGEVPKSLASIIDNLPVSEQRDARLAWIDSSALGDAEAYEGAWTQILDTLRMMRERGIFLIPGTDMGGSFSLHRELELFAMIGFSNAEVLKRATFDMARYLSRDQSLGSIEKGKLADFLLVPGNPVEDLAAIRQVRMVVKGGTVYFPAEIYPHFGIKPFATSPRVAESAN